MDDAENENTALMANGITDEIEPDALFNEIDVDSLDDESEIQENDDEIEVHDGVVDNNNLDINQQKEETEGPFEYTEESDHIHNTFDVDETSSQSNSSTTESSELTNTETAPFIEPSKDIPSQTKSRLPVMRTQSQSKQEVNHVRESLSKKFWKTKTAESASKIKSVDPVVKTGSKLSESSAKSISKTNIVTKNAPIGRNTDVSKSTTKYDFTKPNVKNAEITQKTNKSVEEKKKPNNEKKLTRHDSQILCQDIGIRETLTSRLRFEKRHVTHDQECDADDYMTPTQRKQQYLQDLRQEVKDLTKSCEEKNLQIDVLNDKINTEVNRVKQEKDEEIRQVTDDLKTLQKEHQVLRDSYEQCLHTTVQLQERITQLKEVISEMEKNNDKMYLEMYKKGQESATFERNVELERLAACSDGSSMTMNELIRKLVVTESELAKWQSFRRQESYESVEKPETQSDVTLRFLKDSFFHYLTDNKEHENHLRAMIRIFNFTEVQKKKITSSLTYDKKNKIPPKL